MVPVEGVGFSPGYRVVACLRCGMVFAVDIPTQARLDDYYGRFSKYEGAEAGGGASEVDRLRFGIIADEIAVAVRHPASRLLDVGCATGEFPSALQKVGFLTACGLDPSPACAEIASQNYGVKVHVGTVFDSYPEAPYDGISALGVLEHLRDVPRALRQMANALAPRGWVYVEVPDLEGFPSSREAPFQEFSSEHINFFTQSSLGILAARFGLERSWGGVAQRRHSGGSHMQVLAMGFRRTRQRSLPWQPDTSGAAAVEAYLARSSERAAGEAQVISRFSAAPGPLHVWGAGTLAGRLLATTALRDLAVSGIIDANPHLHGRTMGGRPILPPERLRGSSGSILIASYGHADAIQHRIRSEFGHSQAIFRLDEGIPRDAGAPAR